MNFKLQVPAELVAFPCERLAANSQRPKSCEFWNARAMALGLLNRRQSIGGGSAAFERELIDLKFTVTASRRQRSAAASTSWTKLYITPSCFPQLCSSQVSSTSSLVRL